MPRDPKTLISMSLLGSILSLPVFSFATDFVALERGLLNCNYISSFQRPHRLEKGFQVPNSQICDQHRKDALRTVTEQEPLTAAFPSYSMILQAQGVNPQALLSAKQLLGPVHQAQPERPFQGFSINPASLEQELRLKLTPLDQNTFCKDDQNFAQQIRSARFQQSVWKDLLQSQGYSCTVKTFKSLQQELDRSRGTEKLQKEFEEKLSSTANLSLDGARVLYFPNLGYDLPTIPWQAERERLSPNELKDGLKSLGAEVQIIERVTLESLEQQISQSEKQVLKIFARNPNAKFIFYGRSMGGLIAREVLKRNPEIHSQVQGFLLGGATPYGSVIADYKSRADVFHEVYKQSQSLFSNLIATAAAVRDSHLLRVLKASSRRLNLEQMSHTQFKPETETFSFPVVNLIFLPDTLESFFKNSPRSKSVDFVLLHMTMYGPTEGSAPLAHAVVESQKSATVFISKHNHLAFWEMSKDEALKLTSSALSLMRSVK